MNTVLTINDLVIYRGKNRIIDNLSLDIEKNKIIGLVGPNGAGKSTLIKVLAGLVKKKKGEVICGEYSIDSNICDYLAQFQFCFDTNCLYLHLSAYENLMQLARIEGYAKENVIAALEKVGLKSRMNEKVSSYSYGMRQRVNLAQAILSKKQIIVLDEPLNGIDPEGVVLFRNIICEMKEKYGCTVIISSHLLGELKNMCDSVVFIKKGMVVDNVKLDDSMKNVYRIYVNNIENAYSLLETSNVQKTMGNTYVELETESKNLHYCLKVLLDNGIVIEDIVNYSDIEKVYINKVGGELDNEQI